MLECLYEHVNLRVCKTSFAISILIQSYISCIKICEYEKNYHG